jgi:hypothetical protein
MKKALLTGLLGLLAHTLSAAESSPQDKITSAVKRLGDAPNCSWTTTIKEGHSNSAPFPPIVGKADKGGLMYLSFMIGVTPSEAYVEGQKGILKTREGWKTFDEVAQPGGFAAAIVRILRGFKTPSAETAALSGKLKDVKEDGEVLSGDLKEEAVKELLEFVTPGQEGQPPPKITDIKGSMKCWVQQGVLTKYEINIAGKVARGLQKSAVDRTTTVEIRDLGTTKLEVPPEAKPKML